jgi:protein dithiol oxidoreductase (disulfide-forming)
MVSKQWAHWASAVCAVVGGVVLWGSLATAATPELKGKFEVLKGEVSTHTPGKVKLMEFADFYCPHCHDFDETVLPLLVKEFGSKLEITMVGFPVIPGKLPTPFDMYEQAKMMGKGNEMKTVLFRTIHKDKITGVLDRSLREALIKEVGLDPKAFEEGMASGKPARIFEEGRKWGNRIQVLFTPTVLIDGNIKAETIDSEGKIKSEVDPENLKLIIRSILDADAKK